MSGGVLGSAEDVTGRHVVKARPDSYTYGDYVVLSFSEIKLRLDHGASDRDRCAKILATKIGISFLNAIKIDGAGPELVVMSAADMADVQTHEWLSVSQVLNSDLFARKKRVWMLPLIQLSRLLQSGCFVSMEYRSLKKVQRVTMQNIIGATLTWFGKTCEADNIWLCCA